MKCYPDSSLCSSSFHVFLLAIIGEKEKNAQNMQYIAIHSKLSMMGILHYIVDITTNQAFYWPYKSSMWMSTFS